MDVRRFFNQCRRYKANLGLLAADALPKAERDRVEAHCEKCPSCQARLVEMRRLAAGLARDGENLPEGEPSASLRRRWMTEVRDSGRAQKGAASPPLPVWLSGRGLAWSSLAALWAMILFFQISAPRTAMPTTAASSPPSIREVLLALKTEPREPLPHADGRHFSMRAK